MSLHAQKFRFLLASWLVIFAGCGGPNAQESADYQKEYTLVGEMLDLLDTVKDDDSAEAMKTKLDDLYDRIQEVDASVSKLPESTRAKLYERNKDLVETANSKIGKQVQRQMRGDLPQAMSKYLFVLAKERKE